MNAAKQKFTQKELAQMETSLSRMHFGRPHRQPGHSHSARNLRRRSRLLGRLRSQQRVNREA